MHTRQLLVMMTEENKNRLEIVNLDAENVPEQLNGESGSHIFHASALTALILNEYCANEPSSGLTAQDIEEISVATATHDIGKTMIPDSILNFPGKLSPEQYDIVKDHSVFGEKLIEEAHSGTIPQRILEYAKQIARHHQERYDGSGYPDGLKGDEIPLAAQAVSIADAYDALTSQRSYKPPFPQSVATQMIATGMCGVFNEKIVNALLKVINSNEIIKIREKLKMSEHTV